MTRTHPALSTLRSPPLRWYLAGQLPSVTCSWAQVVALSWVVVDLDPRAVGWVVALQFLPSLLLGPWCGALADRHDRRRLLMLAEAGLGAVALAYAAASAAGVLTMPLICVLAAVWGFVNALDTPARRALIPMLVPAEHAGSASALAGAVMLLGMTAGSAAGSALVAGAGVTVTFAVNALSFLADVAILARLRVGPSPRVGKAPRQIRDGLRHVVRRPMLRTPLLVLAVLATLAFTVQVSVPILIDRSFGGGPAVLGAAFTAVTAGSLAGALTLAALHTPGSRTLRHAVVALAGAMLLTAVAPTVAVAFLGLAVAGYAWSSLLGSVAAMLQHAEPPMMGRVMSLFGVTLLGGTALGGPVAGLLANGIHPRAPFVAGAAAAVAAVWYVRRHRWEPAGEAQAARGRTAG